MPVEPSASPKAEAAYGCPDARHRAGYLRLRPRASRCSRSSGERCPGSRLQNISTVPRSTATKTVSGRFLRDSLASSFASRTLGTPDRNQCPGAPDQSGPPDALSPRGQRNPRSDTQDPGPRSGSRCASCLRGGVRWQRSQRDSDPPRGAARNDRAHRRASTTCERSSKNHSTVTGDAYRLSSPAKHWSRCRCRECYGEPL
jgi:hypothetical protein